MDADGAEPGLADGEAGVGEADGGAGGRGVSGEEGGYCEGPEEFLHPTVSIKKERI